MNSFPPARRLAAVIQPGGILIVENLPFAAGQTVEVTIERQANPVEGQNPYPLHGSVLHYDRPLEPIADDDWNASR